MIPDERAAQRQAHQPPPLLGGFARGVGWTYLSLVLTGGATFFLAAWSVRRVGTAEFGLFALVTSLTGLMAVVDYAMGLAVVRASALAEVGPDVAPADRDQHREAVHAAHGAYALLGLAGVGLTALIAGAMGLVGVGHHRPYLLATVLLLGVATSLDVGTAAVMAVAQGCRWFSLRSGATAAGVAVRVAVALATVGRLGVAGLAAGQLLGVAVERVVAAGMLRRRVRWFAISPSRPDPRALRRVTGFALPLLAINVSGQLFAVSDFVAVGLLVGSSAVGLYHVASMLPIYAVAVLAVGYNVVFPALAGSSDRSDQEAATAFLTRLFSYVSGAVFVLAALLRRDVVELLLGRRSALGETVLVVFCGICLANMFVHGPASLLIARGRQSLMARAVAIELPVNLVLTLWFVVAFGAAGAAVATLVTVLLMDFVIFPVVSRGQFQEPALRTAVRHGMAPAAVGGVVALVAAQAAVLAATGLSRLVVAAVVGSALAVSVGLVLLGAGGRRSLRAAFAKVAPGGAEMPGVVAL
jgi:O-antigen/teichoic acid export membrane protein